MQEEINEPIFLAEFVQQSGQIKEVNIRAVCSEWGHFYEI